MQRAGEVVRADLGKARLAEEKRREPVRRWRRALRRKGRARRLPRRGAETEPGRAIVSGSWSTAAARRPGDRTPRASASALASSAGTAKVCSARISAPSRRRRRARNEAEARSKVSSSAVAIEAAATASISSRVSGAASENARRRRAADDFADREERLARERVMRFHRRRAPVGHQELAGLAARYRRCDRERRRRAGAPGASPSGASGAPVSRTGIGSGARPSPAGRRWPKAG